MAGVLTRGRRVLYFKIGTLFRVYTFSPLSKPNMNLCVSPLKLLQTKNARYTHCQILIFSKCLNPNHWQLGLAQSQLNLDYNNRHTIQIPFRFFLLSFIFEQYQQRFKQI